MGMSWVGKTGTGLAALIALILPGTATAEVSSDFTPGGTIAPELFPITNTRLVNVDTYGPTDYLTLTIENHHTAPLVCSIGATDASNGGKEKVQQGIAIMNSYLSGQKSLLTAAREVDALRLVTLNDSTINDKFTLEAGESRTIHTPGLTNLNGPMGSADSRRAYSNIALTAGCQTSPGTTPKIHGISLAFVEDSGYRDPIPPTEPTDPVDPNPTDPVIDPVDPSPTNPVDPVTPTPGTYGSTDSLLGLFS
ncbi:hypothetical protein [Rhodococcus triatomae]